MKSAEVRKKFLSFFEGKQHEIIPSASLVPENDPTALFNVAGMQPLVPYLMGKPHPKGGRLADSQKCIRTVDIDDVGDKSHLTVFEMLGNWSLGTYFKEEAISMAYEFIKDELKIDMSRVVVTVFEGYEDIERDDEAIELWKKVGMPEDHIFPNPPSENWWPDYGAKGPCGPDTEIFFDLMPGKPHTNPAEDDDRYIEFWNLVFMEYYCDGEGSFTKLEKQNVDTGSGLERLTMMLQGKSTVYETDFFEDMIKKVETEFDVTYAGFKKDDAEMSEEELTTAKRIRIICDHMKAASFLIADGVAPSNEGRGYVLRRIIRRAIFNAKLLKEDAVKSLPELLDVIISIYDGHYPELEDRKTVILQTLEAEITKFLGTLKKGEKLLEEVMHKATQQKHKQINGEDAFTLYDTFGFPISLTEEIAASKGFEVDMDGFAKAMEAQQERSREGSKGMFIRGKEEVQTMLEGLPKTEFEGYVEVEPGKLTMRLEDTTILKTFSFGEEGAALVTDRTCFYAESGGQVGDSGVIFHGDFHFVVTDTQKYDDVWVHFGHLDGDSEKKLDALEGSPAHMQVNEERRMRIMASHTGAHLLHKALQKYLGEDVQQAGSYVDEYRTRFDFSFDRALTTEEIQHIEQEVNDAIARWEPVMKKELPFKEAKDAGAIGLFSEKYGDTVRVCFIGDAYSRELCGGTHVANTSEIGIAKIIKESSIASGVRRLEMITGANVYDYLKEQSHEVEALMAEVKANAFGEVREKVVTMKQALKDAEKLLSEAKAASAKGEIAGLKDQAIEKDGVTYLNAEVAADSMEGLKQIAYGLRDQNAADVALLYTADGQFVVYSEADDVSVNDLMSSLRAIGAKGGGSPKFAQGVGLDTKQAPNVSLMG